MKTRLFRTAVITATLLTAANVYGQSMRAGSLVRTPGTRNDSPPAQQEHEWQGVAAGMKIGTLGPGAELTVDLIPQLNLRVNANYLKYSYDREIDDIDWEIELDFSSFLLMLDWHPFENDFRLTGGVIRNDSETTLNGTPNENVEIGNNTYPPELVGTLSGKLTFADLAPYIGVGIGNAVDKDTSLSFIFDLGLIFQTLDVELAASGPVKYLPQFQDDLRKEEEDIQDDLDGLKVYPVLAIGLAYHF